MHLLGGSSELAALGVEQLNDPVQYTSILEEAQLLDDEEYAASLTPTLSLLPQRWWRMVLTRSSRRQQRMTGWLASWDECVLLGEW